MTSNLLGQTSLACLRHVVTENPHIARLTLTEYAYQKGRHDANKEVRMDRNAFLKRNFLSDFESTHELEWQLGISSRAELKSGKKAHLCLMDLQIPKGSEAIAFIKERLTDVIVPHFGGGFILETGRSYHFIGTRLIAQKDFGAFLGRFLLTELVEGGSESQIANHTPVADARYIGHALLRGSTVLRFSSRGESPFVPKVVAVV